MAREVSAADARDLERIGRQEAEIFAADAQRAALQVIPETFVTISREAILSVKQAALDRNINRPIRGMETIRAAVDEVLTDELIRNSSEISVIAHEAIVEGYATELIGRSDLYSRRRTAFIAAADVTKDEEERLHKYPVLGHTITEWINQIYGGLRFDLHGLLVEPVVGSILIEDLPGRVDKLVQTHASDVRSLVLNAHIAGAEAAGYVWRDFIARMAARQRRNER